MLGFKPSTSGEGLVPPLVRGARVTGRGSKTLNPNAKTTFLEKMRSHFVAPSRLAHYALVAARPLEEGDSYWCHNAALELFPHSIPPTLEGVTPESGICSN